MVDRTIRPTCPGCPRSRGRIVNSPRILVPIAFLFLAFASEAMALRCSDRIIETGDRSFEVRERCGEPYWVSDEGTVRAYGAYGPLLSVVGPVVENWYYNFGPNRLVQKLVFVDGRLRSIEAQGHGRSRVGEDCDNLAFERGRNEGELVLRCGPPDARHVRSVETRSFGVYGEGYFQAHREEEWVYHGIRRGSVRLVLVREGGVLQFEDVPVD